MTNIITRSTKTKPPELILLQRVEAEYAEMPGLALTPAQVARLWNLDLSQSVELLAELVNRGFLVRDAAGMFRRPGYPECTH